MREPVTLSNLEEWTNINLQKILEDTGANAIQISLSNNELQRNSLSQNGKLVRADFVIALNGEKIPVEIKHNQIREATIMQMGQTMSEISSSKGVLITSSSS